MISHETVPRHETTIAMHKCQSIPHSFSLSVRHELNISLTASPLDFLPPACTKAPAVFAATPATELTDAEADAVTLSSPPPAIYQATRRVMIAMCSGRYRQAAAVKSVRVRKRIESASRWLLAHDFEQDIAGKRRGGDILNINLSVGVSIYNANVTLYL
jgi:hypothetical protein